MTSTDRVAQSCNSNFLFANFVRSPVSTRVFLLAEDIARDSIRWCGLGLTLMFSDWVFVGLRISGHRYVTGYPRDLIK